jgi:hypothetical protein
MQRNSTGEDFFCFQLIYWSYICISLLPLTCNKDDDLMTSTCPQCKSKAFKRNGYTRHGKQNHRCLDCGRQFSVEPYNLPNTPHIAYIQNILIDELVRWKEAFNR